MNDLLPAHSAMAFAARSQPTGPTGGRTGKPARWRSRAAALGWLLVCGAWGATALAQDNESDEAQHPDPAAVLAPSFAATGMPNSAAALATANAPTLSTLPYLPASVATSLSRAGLPAHALSVVVLPIQHSAPPRLSIGAEQRLNPASVMKLVTTYAAIDTLGPDFTWRTGFYTDGTVGQGMLNGNLYVRGGGDPKLVLERIQSAFQSLQTQGVMVVMGDMVLDHSAFRLPIIDPGAFDGEALRPYNASPDALLVNFKSVVLNFEPDRAAGVAHIRSEPPLAGLAIDATVPLSKTGCGNWRGALQGQFGNPNEIRFAGRYPQSCGNKVWPVAYQDPASYAARALEGLWRSSGGALAGRVRSGITPRNATLLHEAKSLPLRDIISDVNQWSNNVMAQQVFLTLGRLAPGQSVRAGSGAASLGLTGQTSFESARGFIGDWWRRRFGAASAPVMENGSGLSRQERITPNALAQLLLQAAAHPQAEPFVNSLSIAGQRGTAARMARGRDSQARGNAWLKTGTLRDVSGVAGYVNAVNGQRFVVVAFVSHPNASAGRPALEALLEWAATGAP